MQTPTPGAQTPDTVESVVAAPQAPQKVGTIPGLKNKIMTALAALGIMASAEKVEGAVTLTYAAPSFLPASSSNTLQENLPSDPSTPPIYNVRVRNPAGTPGTINTPYTGISRFTINVTDPGLLTISWNATIGTGEAPNDVSVTGFANTDYYVNQRAQFGLSTGTMNTINLFVGGQNLPNLTNDGINGLGADEIFTNSSNFSKDVFVTPGTYYFDSRLEGMNTVGFNEVRNLQFSLNTSIPEPSTGALVLAGASAALLRRRRKQEKDVK